MTQQVRDSDLAILVDGLWNAGAEAISVNGKRLTNLTAFRNVGPAIHIGITPLVPPYTVLVIGDPDTLPANLLESTFGQQWYSLVESLGFVYDIDPDDSLPARPHGPAGCAPCGRLHGPGRSPPDERGSQSP